MTFYSEYEEVEYEALKAEQRQRISTRDNIHYLQIISIATLFSISDKVPNLLNYFLIPFCCLVLGWMFISNDIIISQIRKYLESKFSVSDENVSNWEVFHREEGARRSKKIISLFINFLTFVVPGVVSCIFILIHPISCCLIALTLFELLCLLFLTVQLILSADF